MTRTIEVRIEEVDGTWFGTLRYDEQEAQRYEYASEDEANEKLQAAVLGATKLMMKGLVTRITAIRGEELGDGAR